jgi:hypothetical protein
LAEQGLSKSPEHKESLKKWLVMIPQNPQLLLTSSEEYQQIGTLPQVKSLKRMIYNASSRGTVNWIFEKRENVDIKILRVTSK